MPGPISDSYKGPDGGDIYDPSDWRICARYRKMRFWEKGFDVAKRWFHEEWDGSSIQLDLARDIAQAIESEVSSIG